MQLIWRTMDLVKNGLPNENEILFPEILLFLKQTFEILRKVSYLEIEVGIVIDNRLHYLTGITEHHSRQRSRSKRRLLLVYLGPDRRAQGPRLGSQQGKWRCTLKVQNQVGLLGGTTRCRVGSNQNLQKLSSPRHEAGGHPLRRTASKPGESSELPNEAVSPKGPVLA